LSTLYDLAWNPQGRIVYEAQLGLTAARIRGINEAKAPLLCFVDDDNILDTRYLEKAIEIAKERPDLGCFGGNIIGEYEEIPPPWFNRYEEMIAVRPLERDHWGNFYRYDDATPCGAGMCIRADVARYYRDTCVKSHLRVILDRKGNSLASSGDIDLAYTAIDMGHGTGRFVSLSLIHIIPKARTSIDYLERLAEATEESNVYLNHVRNMLPKTPDKTGIFRKWIQRARMQFRMKKEHRRLHLARERGRRKGMVNIQNVSTNID
jgi:glycosyltransferase involved in cell wall biosynthesis